MLGKQTMEKNTRNILERALLDENSTIYLCKNIKTIKKYLKLKNIDLDENQIKEFLLTQKSSSQITTNTSRRKIAEISKGFFGQQSFFSQIHTDICVLSKKRPYFTKDYLILLVIELLSNYVFLEIVKSTSFKYISEAFRNIFKRSSYLPEKCRVIVSDRGIEYKSLGFQELMKKLGIKMNFVNSRPIRLSKGSGIAERANRRLRRHLEAILEESEVRKKPLGDVIKMVENIMNRESQTALNGLSSLDALAHSAKYISMVRSSLRFSRRKYRKQEMMRNRNISLYSIVRIKHFNDKKAFEKKESYGVLSKGLFIVIDIKQEDLISYYYLGSLLSLKPIAKCSYNFYELQVVPISYSKACYIESINNITSVIGVMKNGYITYKAGFDDSVILGPPELVKL